MSGFWQRLMGNTVADPPKVGTMLKKQELDHLFDLARTRFTGQGTIVDLGTWLGGSTVAFCDGLKKNTDPRVKGHKLHAFDLFVLNAWLKKAYPLPELAAIPEGGSFLPVFEQNLAPWSDLLETHAGDLTVFEWTHGPVELVHVDIMKTWSLANAVLRLFFQELIPGVSIVLHQDFVHYNTVWIHLLMYRLKDHFEPIGQVPGTTTVEFRLKTAIPKHLLTHAYGFSDFDEVERKAAFAYSRSLVADEFMRFNIDAAEAMTPVHMGHLDEARVLLDAALSREAAFKKEHPQERRRSELVKVQERLESASS